MSGQFPAISTPLPPLQANRQAALIYPLVLPAQAKMTRVEWRAQSSTFLTKSAPKNACASMPLPFSRYVRNVLYNCNFCSQQTIWIIAYKIPVGVRKLFVRRVALHVAT